MANAPMAKAPTATAPIAIAPSAPAPLAAAPLAAAPLRTFFDFRECFMAYFSYRDCKPCAHFCVDPGENQSRRCRAPHSIWRAAMNVPRKSVFQPRIDSGLMRLGLGISDLLLI